MRSDMDGEKSTTAARTGDGGDRAGHAVVVGTGLLLAMTLTLASRASAMPPTAPPSNDAESPAGQTVLYFLFAGGSRFGIACTVPIIGLSVATLAMLIEQLIMLRRTVLMPAGLADEVRGNISSGSFSHAEQQCKLRPSLLAAVILAGLDEVGRGFAAVEKAMEDALQMHAARIVRKIELLATIANISTMLGLFGTVLGLAVSFRKVADAQGVARAGDLASGISLALVTTLEGLAVAILAIGAYALFKHRAEHLIAEAAMLADHAFAGFKRDRLARREAKMMKSTGNQ